MAKLSTDEYVDRLIEAADEEMRRGKVEPEQTWWAESVHLAWKRAEPIHFARLALLAALPRPPWEPEREEFLRRLQARIPAQLRAS